MSRNDAKRKIKQITSAYPRVTSASQDFQSIHSFIWNSGKIL